MLKQEIARILNREKVNEGEERKNTLRERKIIVKLVIKASISNKSFYRIQLLKC